MKLYYLSKNKTSMRPLSHNWLPKKITRTWVCWRAYD